MTSLDRSGYLTTQRFAWAVDEPVSTILKKHRSGEFPAAVPGKLGRGRRSLYAPEQVADYKLRALLSHGAAAATEDREPPEAVVTLFEAWCKLLPISRIREILARLSAASGA